MGFLSYRNPGHWNARNVKIVHPLVIAVVRYPPAPPNLPRGPAVSLFLYPRVVSNVNTRSPQYEENMNTRNVVSHDGQFIESEGGGSSNVHHNVCSGVQNMAAQYRPSHVERGWRALYSSLPV